jgi:hypothetical protein
MSGLRTTACACLFAATALLAQFPLAAFGAQIWVGGHDPTTRSKAYPDQPTDFMDLFAPDAPWKAAAKKISVFKVASRFILQGTDDQLKMTFAGLKARGIALAIETGVLFDPVCGKGMEGFAYWTSSLVMANRIKKLGGDLKYIALDEQLWFGHFANGPSACHFPISEIARQVALHAKEFRSVFPNVKIGAIEPIAAVLPVSTLKDYLDAYRSAFGEPFAFLHGDVQWSRDWRRDFVDVARLTKSEGVPFGPIIDSDHPRDDTGAAWNNHALADLNIVNQLVGMKNLDYLVVQTWTREPQKWLPETSPGALLHLVLQLN